MHRRVPAKATHRLFMAAALVVMAGGCGFQLRDAPPVSPALQPLAVTCIDQVPADLCDAVLDQLDLGDVNVQKEDSAKFILRLSRFEQDRRATAITGQAAAAEYTVRYSVAMELISHDKIPIIANTRLITSESYRYDEANVLAKQREEDSLRLQLNRRLAQQIIFRLAPLTEARIQAIRDQQPNTP